MFRPPISATRLCSSSQSLTTAKHIGLAVENCFLTTCTSESRRQIHSSSLSHESARKQAARMKKKDGQAKRIENQRLAMLKKPHPVLGYSRGNERLWLDSKLAKTVLTEEIVRQEPIPQIEVAMEPSALGAPGRMVPKLLDERPVPLSIELPKYLNYGVGEDEKKLLFEDTPHLRHTAAVIKAELEEQGKLPWSEVASTTERKNFNIEEMFLNNAEVVRANDAVERAERKSESREQLNRYWLGRLLDLRNAGAGGLEFENRQRIVAAFSTPEIPFNPGRTEVQVALLTHKIHRLWKHLQIATRDIHNRKEMLTYLHDRASILKYLRRKNRVRYEALLPQIGVEATAVEGEIILPRTIWKADWTSTAWS